ncbi:alpha/beta hydrolase [Herbiconiux sp. P18]|uniref:alpha/beta hydrolase n=1 Tax=Herbiconiux liangxiaofengii TaxID=3342795 RepID=UPI0035B99547
MTSPPERRRHLSRRAKLIVAAVVVLVLAAPFIVNAITPWPLALGLRAIVEMNDDTVTEGPLAPQMAAVPEPEQVSVPVDGLPDARLTVYGASDDAGGLGKPVVLLIHGGGWILGTASQIADYAKLLASAGYVVANLDYSVAPEHEYPAPVLQSVAALDYLSASSSRYGGDPTRLFVAGNSAGAQLAAQVGALVTNPALREQMGVAVTTPADDLRGVILYSGPYDFDTVGRTGFPAFDTFAWSYLGRKDWASDPRLDQLSTTRTATADYPPTYLTSGDADPLEPQTYELDAVLQARGVDVTSRYWTGTGSDLPHDYVFDLSTEGARTAFADTVAFVDRHAR